MICGPSCAGRMMFEVLLIAAMFTVVFFAGSAWGRRPRGLDVDRVVVLPPGIPPQGTLVVGVYEVPLAPGLSTRFGYCPACNVVWRPTDEHDCRAVRA